MSSVGAYSTRFTERKDRMKKYISIILALLLLTGCKAEVGGPGAARPTGESPTPVGSVTPDDPAAPEPTQTLPPTAEPAPVETSDPAGVLFDALPVTEEKIQTFYTSRPDRRVVKVTPYEGDFLVEWTDYDITGRDSWASVLDWIFGASGRVVRLTGMEEFSSYGIRDRGQVYYTTGTYSAEGWQELPRRREVTVPGGAWDNLETDMSSGLYCSEVDYGSWMAPQEPLRIAMFSGRYEQLCDACVDAEGLSFSFIPDTENMEKFQSFFPACTSTPGFETVLDEKTGTFTLRLYNTSLKSKTLTAEMAEWIGGYQDYGGLYPRIIPEGSLGPDTLFLTGTEIRQDGADVVITAQLTERAGWFTVDCGNLGYDNIPYLRLRFRESNSIEVGGNEF